jgi:hypothetical protein
MFRKSSRRSGKSERAGIKFVVYFSTAIGTPMTSHIPPNLTSFLGKHLVALAATQVWDGPQRDTTFFVAGCLFEHAGEWFFITAGHCLNEIEEALRTSRVENFRLVDYTGHQALNKMPIPFDFRNTFRQALVDDRCGVDFGVVYIEPYYRQLLQRNGVEVVDRINWDRQPEDFEMAWMIGIPNTLVQYSDDSSILLSTVSLPLDILSETPEQFLKNSPPDLTDSEKGRRDGQFYARIPGDYQLPKNEAGRDDIKGMSGGPIFGFKRADERTKYWVAAIQSAWYADTRTVRGCPMPFIGANLARFIDEWKTEYQKWTAQASDSPPL